MIRTKTTVVVGAGAGVELDLPDARELLSRIAQGFDFQRLGSALQTPEMQDFDGLFRKVKGKHDELRQAATRLRAGARLTSSVHALLQQHGNDEHVVAVGKLAIAYYTLRAEAQSPMTEEPRDPGEMPLRGSENWLFQLGRMVVDGVPRARAESCFDNLHLISFGTDRSIQHYMPWVLHSGFGMDLTEAQAICAEKLRVAQPFGRAGKLPWQAGSEAVAGWGQEKVSKLFSVAENVRTLDEFLDDRPARAAFHGALAKTRRLVFLGFDFGGMESAMLFDERFTQPPEVLAALREASSDSVAAVRALLAQKAGVPADSVLGTPVTSCWKALRDNAIVLES